MATKELSINQILCASLEELKDYAISKGITLPSSATKPIIQGLLITACSKSDETQILQAKCNFSPQKRTRLLANSRPRIKLALMRQRR